MAGYNWSAGKSNNAVNAEFNGLIKRSEMSAWQKRAVDAGAVQRREWHHASKFFNRVDYFDPADFADLNPADFPPVPKTEKPAKPLTKAEILALPNFIEGTKSELEALIGLQKHVSKSTFGKKGWFVDHDYDLIFSYGGADTPHRVYFASAESMAEAVSEAAAERERRAALSAVRAFQKHTAAACGFPIESASGKFYRTAAEKDAFESKRPRLVKTEYGVRFEIG